MLNTPFSPWPSYTDEEAHAVQRVLLSNKVNYWTGNECREFEREFATWCGTRHAIALANGTLALDLALKGLGIGPGDEVVVTPRTFIASVSCVVNAGATPVFADVEADSGNLSARTVAQVLTARTKAIICVHLAGWPCDMDPIMKLAEQHSLKVIEDCAQAHGALYKGCNVGSIGHVGAWSFCQDKIMTTGGEGGMVTVNDEQLWRDMWAYKDHGKSYAAAYERQHPPGFRWLHESFGTNWRMLEMQATLGRIQLKRLPEWTRQRNANARVLAQAFREFADTHGPIRLPVFGACNTCRSPNASTPPSGCNCLHAQYKFYVYVQQHNLASGWSRDRVVAAINDAGVPCYQGSCSEVYREKAFEGMELRPVKPMATSRSLGESSLMFLVHPTLTEAEITKTAVIATQVLSQARIDRN